MKYNLYVLISHLMQNNFNIRHQQIIKVKKKIN